MGREEEDLMSSLRVEVYHSKLAGSLCQLEYQATRDQERGAGLHKRRPENGNDGMIALV